jgi:hypothetical protein
MVPYHRASRAWAADRFVAVANAASWMGEDRNRKCWLTNWTDKGVGWGRGGGWGQGLAAL